MLPLRQCGQSTSQKGLCSTLRSEALYSYSAMVSFSGAFFFPLLHSKHPLHFRFRSNHNHWSLAAHFSEQHRQYALDAPYLTGMMYYETSLRKMNKRRNDRGGVEDLRRRFSC